MNAKCCPCFSVYRSAMAQRFTALRPQRPRCNATYTSTAFSPTDGPVLSRWAKTLMMLPSMISLLVVALFAARAVNIL